VKYLATTLFVLTFTSGLHAAESEEIKRLTVSAEALTEIQETPDKGIPTGLFHKAQCVVVIPGMKKAGFIFSGKYGRGFAYCRNPAGGWAGPAGMRIEGGGFGLQAGGSETDVVLLVMSPKGMQGLLKSKFTLGGEASVAAGPVGRDATAQTDATMRADILSWSRSRGVFGGLSLQGGTLRADEDANKALYSSKVTTQDILTGKTKNPVPSDEFAKALGIHGGTQKAN
jgi:lipid-binding SYLF domain-containing protein